MTAPATASRIAFPTQGQLTLGLLDVLHEKPRGPKSLADELARRFDVPSELREARVPIRGGRETVNALDRHVRFALLKARAMRLVESPERNLWVLTPAGEKGLRSATPGVVITLITGARGVGLWGYAEDAAALLDDESVALLMTSPPYPLLRPKAYGNLDEREHVEWLVRIIERYLRKMDKQASIVLNLADVYRRGKPVVSTYIDRMIVRLEDELGLQLSGRFIWDKGNAVLPTPAEWVNVRRCAVKSSTEWLLHFAVNAEGRTRANNRNVLVPYSDAMKRLIAKGGEKATTKPSGHAFADGAFKVDNDGAIPTNVLRAPLTSSNDAYHVGCKALGIPRHPARFPGAIPNFFIRYLTNSPDHLVADIFGGSGTTAQEAERLGRPWFLVERDMTSLASAHVRLGPIVEDYEWYGGQIAA
ncbi:MAG: DNA-methyltransferase [Gemmatimonadaceae bacterium]